MQKPLTKPQETSTHRHSSSELKQLLKEIDEAINYSKDAVVRRALQKIGLSSEEIIALLQDSRAYVNELNNLE